jgi:hypothetical protein
LTTVFRSPFYIEIAAILGIALEITITKLIFMKGQSYKCKQDERMKHTTVWLDMMPVLEASTERGTLLFIWTWFCK